MVIDKAEVKPVQEKTEAQVENPVPSQKKQCDVCGDELNNRGYCKNCSLGPTDPVSIFSFGNGNTKKKPN